MQSVLVPRKIAELELEFEIPTWNSNYVFPPPSPIGRALTQNGKLGIPWDFGKFTVNFTNNSTINLSKKLYNTPPQVTRCH